MIDYEISQVLKAPLLELMSHSSNLYYIIDENLNIVYLNIDYWNEFASNNGYKPITSEIVDLEEQFIGKPILDFFEGKDIVKLWSKIFNYSLENIKEVDIPFKCPSPEIMRFGLMEVIPFHAPTVRDSEELKKFLVVRSIMYHQTNQPEMKIYDLNDKIDNDLPYITICSFCRKIYLEEEEIWVDGQEYYNKGGSNNVNISHGICSKCLKKIELKLN